MIIASKGGAPGNPDRHHNILANPMAIVEMGADQFQAKATIMSEPERTCLFNKMAEVIPGFAEYQKRRSRVIPVITLERLN